MSTFPWTDEQRGVLSSAARVTVVQAGPGSGKTKVFAEVIRQRLQGWGGQAGGVAALSFTNAARSEIADRVGEVFISPHFVGTLDSFFLRFVVAPFGHLAGLPRTGARLIPSPFDQQLSKPDVNLGTAIKADFVSIFALTPVSGDEGQPEFVARRPYGRPATPVTGGYASKVRAEKTKEWANNARVTHGDTHYLAARILLGPYGAAVRRIVSARFPVICVDEFQDTGHFLGRAVLSLLAEQSIVSLVVGDVDQKIFGFSGVNPDLFVRARSLHGAAAFPLQTSQRCSARVAAVACALSRSGATVRPSPSGDSGMAVLMRHLDEPDVVHPETVNRAVGLGVSLGCQKVAVLLRKVIDKTRLQRGAVSEAPPIACRAVGQVVRAIDALKDGRGYLAIEIVEALLCRTLLDDERPTKAAMRSCGVEPEMLRRYARSLILAVIDVCPGETWGEWSGRVKAQVDLVAGLVGVTDHKARLGGLFKKNKKDRPSQIRTAEEVKEHKFQLGVNVEFLTVHEAKGREFDAVVFYCPKPRRGSACPSESWWAAAPDEEREVAFVAATRARRLFVLALHDVSLVALKKSHSGFVALFDEEATDPVKEAENA